MSQPSTTAVALRALVMLAFLIAVPAIALFGTGVPDTIKQYVERTLGISFGATAQRSDAPLFAPAVSGPAALPTDTPLVPPLVTMPNAPGQPNLPGASPTPAPFTANPQAMPLAPMVAHEPRPGGEVMPVRYDAPLAAPPAAPPAGPPVVRPEQSLTAPQNTAVPPLSVYPPMEHLAQVDRRAPPAAPNAAFPAAAPGVPSENREAPRPVVTPAPPTAGDPLTQIQNRLRELGATYSLLETWGTQGQLYRFYCKTAIGGSANYTRYFEATDSDPIRAMTNVLQQVEVWRQGRMQ